MRSSALLLLACGPSPADDKPPGGDVVPTDPVLDTAPTPDTDTDTDADTDADTDTDTDTDADPLAPHLTVVGMPGGGAHRTSPNWSLRLTVGDPVAAHALASEGHRLSLGVGTTQVVPK